MKTVEERLKSYEPLWENWTYSGEFLGEGAMSSVFEIQSTAMGFKEVAALKIVTVKKNLHGEVKIPESALNEIKILRDLSGCPNIVNYHDSTQRQIFDENNQLSEIDILIKMEKLAPLSEGDSLSEEQIIKLGKDMCNALIHASEHNIIHRDIKPQNIFVDKEGTYKLGDFGIAKIVSDFTAGFTMNIGTLAYTAPEIHKSTTGTYDVSSDIYSLGLVLYVFLNNGCLPFAVSSSTLNEAISKRLSGAPFPSPSRGNKNLKTIIMRACASDISKRYKTPKEMLEDLELLSTGGKKMVVDPFATLDANIDIIEDSFGTVTSSSPSGLRIRMSSSSSSSPTPVSSAPISTPDVSAPAMPYVEEKSAEKPSAERGTRLRINMPSKDKASLSSAPPPVPESISTPTPTPAPASSVSSGAPGKRLIINMSSKSKTEPDSVSAIPEAKPTEVKPSEAPGVKKDDDKSDKGAPPSSPFFTTPNSI